MHTQLMSSFFITLYVQVQKFIFMNLYIHRIEFSYKLVCSSVLQTVRCHHFKMDTCPDHVRVT